MTGEIDLNTGTDIDTVMAAAFVSAGAQTAIVDLAAVTFLDSTEVSCLIRSKQLAYATGIDLRIIGTTERVMQVLEMIGVWHYLTRPDE